MKEMSLEQRVVVIWCPNMTSEREKEDICWEHFFWMHENDTAKDDYHKRAPSVSNPLTLMEMQPLIQCMTDLIKANLALALVSPSLYVRTWAELIVKEAK